MSKRHSFAGKALVAAACALTIATTTPVANTFAYSTSYGQDYAVTTGVKQMDIFRGVTSTSDGGAIAFGQGRTDDNSSKLYAYLVKFDKSGNIEWKKSLENTSSQNDSINKVIELQNGNYIVIGGINGTTTFIELSKDGQTVVAEGINNVTDVIQIDDFSYVGVGDNNYLYMISRVANEHNVGYATTSATNVSDATNISVIERFGDQGYMAVESAQNSSKIYFGARNSDYPKTITIDNAQIFDLVEDKDGNIIAAGAENGKPCVYKLNPETRELVKKTPVDCTPVEGIVNQSAFRGIDVLDNGEIVAAGISDYSASPSISGIHYNSEDRYANGDGVYARFDKDLNLINANAVGGSRNDTILGVSTNGSTIYVAGVSSSDDFGVKGIAKTDDGNIELFGYMSRIAPQTTANVTFEISNTPDGAKAPENGDYTWTSLGENNIPDPKTPAGYVFSGWYTDEGLKNELGSNIPTDDLTLYGTFVKTDGDTDSMACEGSPVTKCENPISNLFFTSETADPIPPRVPAEYTGNNFTGKWISENESIATVDQNGKVTGVSEGSTMIYFVVYDANGNEVYRYAQLAEVFNRADEETPENPNTADNFTGIIAAVLASGAVLGAGFFVASRRR